MDEKRYKQLLEKEAILDCLEEFGVDNWEGYSDAMKEARQRVKDIVLSKDELNFIHPA